MFVSLTPMCFSPNTCADVAKVMPAGLVVQPFCQSVSYFLLQIVRHVRYACLVAASWLHIHAHVVFLLAVEPCAHSAGAPRVYLAIDEDVFRVFLLEVLHRALVECRVEVVVAVLNFNIGFLLFRFCAPAAYRQRLLQPKAMCPAAAVIPGRPLFPFTRPWGQSCTAGRCDGRRLY